MKYLLTQEEMDNLIPLQKHQEVYNSLLDTIDRPRVFIKHQKHLIIKSD